MIFCRVAAASHHPTRAFPFLSPPDKPPQNHATSCCQSGASLSPSSQVRQRRYDKGKENMHKQKKGPRKREVGEYLRTSLQPFDSATSDRTTPRATRLASVYDGYGPLTGNHIMNQRKRKSKWTTCTLGSYYDRLCRSRIGYSHL